MTAVSSKYFLNIPSLTMNKASSCSSSLQNFKLWPYSPPVVSFLVTPRLWPICN